MARLLQLALIFTATTVAGLRWLDAAGAGVAIVAAASLLIPALHWVPLRRGGARAVFALLGLAAGGSAGDQARNDCRTTIDDGAAVTAVAVLDGLPDPGGRVVLLIEAMRVGGVPLACSGHVSARLPQRLAAFNGGGHVIVAGSWWSIGSSGRWPRRPDRTGTLSVTSIGTAANSHSHPLVAARVHALERVRSAFTEQAALAESLLLARRERLDAAVRDDFAAAGLAHLLAISGAHVGILGGIVLLVARMAGMRPRAAAITAAGLLSLYVAVLGAPAAATRAAIQGLAVLSSRLLQRPAEPITLLAGAGLAIIAFDPIALLGAGFQLSFAGVFGLIAFGPPIQRAMPERVPRLLASATVPTLAATAATAPIAAWHFGLVALVGPMANLIAAPLLGLAIPSMVVTLATASVSTNAGAFIGAGAEVLLRLLRQIAEFAAGMPFSHVWVPADSVTTIMLAVAMYLMCGPAVRRRFQHRPHEARSVHNLRIVVRTALASTTLVLWPVITRTSGQLEIHVIDVGQGDAIAIRTPRDRWILVDAGPATPTFDAGRDRVAPYLRERGVRRIDLLVLTHPDMDHIGGARALFDEFDVGAVMDPAMAAGKQLYIETLTAAEDAGYRWLDAQAGREIEADDVLLRVLAPDSAVPDIMPDANDFSVVFLLQYGDFSALFLGDAPESVEDELVARHGTLLQADILKVGHHGSRTSTGDSLLAVVQPALALISVGRRNRYGHPAPSVLQRLGAHGIRVARTDSSGTIVVRAHVDGRHELFATR